MPRLRTADPSSPGWTLSRTGAHLAVIDERGAPLTAESATARVEALSIPPAWTAVWIAPQANAHIQAMGTDAAGRRQYLYHEQWQRARSRLKYDRALDLAASLPAARGVVTRDLRGPRHTRARALAVAFRLLDSAYLRVGSERYAQRHGSRGLTTLRGSDARVSGDTVLLEFTGKGAVDWSSQTTDPDLAAAVRALKRRGPDAVLLAWKDDDGWHRVLPEEVNEYVRERTKGNFSAKDFRTLHGTIIAAQALAAQGPAAHGSGSSATARKKAIVEATRVTAEALGNTPTVARANYIDPRVFDRFRDGRLLTTAGLAPESAIRLLLLGEDAPAT
ncbi:DNA topoisomerase IB [Microterricola pindariensis]|uniref:DNA topoisomerase n=1 Tax=Microterricola pindariensis TaxID=478010 RepID=A0ABX5ATN4_9MICO|nr:DNA topoisomerase IB [Microterricola pindariensis]PPL15204.1 hypothetical protein GY24_14670 [Microterricola pindariensis]